MLAPKTIDNDLSATELTFGFDGLEESIVMRVEVADVTQDVAHVTPAAPAACP